MAFVRHYFFLFSKTEIKDIHLCVNSIVGHPIVLSATLKDETSNIFSSIKSKVFVCVCVRVLHCGKFRQRSEKTLT